MFGQVLDKLDVWFGRPFLIASYLPSLLFAVTNAALAYAAFPGTRPALMAFLQGAASDKAVDLLIALAIVAVFAFAVTPLIRLATNLLEGAHMPSWLAAFVVIGESLRQEAAAAEQQRLGERFAALPRKDDNVIVRLGAARGAGAQLRTIWDEPAIEAASLRIETLRMLFYRRRPIGADAFAEAEAALEAALRQNCADAARLFPDASAADKLASSRLRAAHKWFAEVAVPYSRAIVIDEWERATNDPYDRAGRVNLAPTYLGNQAAALRRYCKDRYGIDFDAFWPLFQLALKDVGLKNAVATSKTQMDFAVLMLALASVTTVGWTLLLGLSAGDDVRLFAGVAVGGGFACWYALRTVRRSYADFASVVRASIDMARFDVLDALRIELPDGIGSEAALWKRVNKLLVAHDQGADISFKHPAKP